MELFHHQIRILKLVKMKIVGKKELMSLLAPSGPVFYSGTFNGHPLSVAASLKTLEILERDQVITKASRLTDLLGKGVNESITKHGVNAICQNMGSVWALYFFATSVVRSSDLLKVSSRRSSVMNEKFRTWMRNNGIYIHQRHIIRGFVSASHIENDIEKTLALIDKFFIENLDDLRFD